MSLQLFSFGHPCEHQLRRTCIGGSSCPLNGYPDTWCCSFIKGKINFKRDKPCEGPRCRWGFTHPSQSQFDAVTHVLNESRPIVAKIDDGDEKEQLSFNIENPHIVDTVQCALHMMRNPPSGRATRVGQLLAYAALRAADPKVFMQLLKTLKKPVDGYLLGAYDYLTGGNLPVTPLPAAVASHANAQGGKSAGKKGGHSEKKEDVSEELRNDMVDLMNAALSSGGQLVNREDQHTLQAVFIQALRSYPKSNKKRQEMLELAVAKFGSRPVAKNTAATTAAASQATPGNTAVTNNTASTTTSAATANTPRHAGAVSMAAAAAGAGTTNTSTTAPTATTATTTTATVNTTALGKSVATSLRSPSGMGATGAAVHAGGGSNTNSNNSNTTVGAGAYSSRNPSKLSDVLDEDEGGMHSHSNNHHGANSNNNMTTIRRPQAIGGSSTALSLNPRVKDSSSMSPAKQQQPTLQEPSQQQQQQLQPPAHPQPVVGISRLAQQMRQNPPRHYEPIRTDLPLPPVALLGGLLGLTQQSAAWALLGGASSHKTSSAVPNTPAAAAAAAASATVGSGSPFAEAEAELDNKVLRFLSSSGPGYNYFGGIDGLPADQQCLKVVYDD